MANSLISVEYQTNLDALISATALGFLSNKMPMAIEVPNSEVKTVTGVLEDKGIAHQIWAIGSTGRLIFERAIDPLPIPKSHQSRYPIKYAAFGELRSIPEWLKDSRCVVSEASIRVRVKAGWDFTNAITKVSRDIKYAAFGELKSIQDWVLDSRCAAPVTTIRRRVNAGWDFTDAITKPNPTIKYAAFGELKSIKDWLKDSRCLVLGASIRRRVVAGWSMEKALRTPYQVPKIKTVESIRG